MKAAGPDDLDRRRLLTAAVLLLSGAVLPPALASSLDAGGPAAWWQTLFREPGPVAALGRQYLLQHRQEASAPWLARQVLGSDWPLDDIEAARDGIVSRIRDGRQRDFGAGDVVVMDGWFFARTEARLMALVAMTAG